MKCLDTYALIEFIEGNPKFQFLASEEVVIPDIIMAEFYAGVYRAEGLSRADFWYGKFCSLCRNVSCELLLKAMRYRVDHRKENLSFFDCVGYIFARENGFIFVTGDKEFKTKEGVQFITK